MRILKDLFAPKGTTSRKAYWGWLLSLPVSVVAVDALAQRVDLPTGFLDVFYVALIACLVLQTVRRLHDAGLSRWWAVLLAFPFSVNADLDLVQPEFFDVTLDFGNLGNLIKSVPLILGLALPAAAKPFEQSAQQIEDEQAKSLDQHKTEPLNV